MKIGQVPGVTGVYNKQGVTKVEKPKQTEGSKDVVTISGDAQVLSTARKAVFDVPDIREDVVADFQKKIEDGTYKPEVDKIAEKMAKNINVIV